MLRVASTAVPDQGSRNYERLLGRVACNGHAAATKTFARVQMTFAATAVRRNSCANDSLNTMIATTRKPSTFGFRVREAPFGYSGRSPKMALS